MIRSSPSPRAGWAALALALSNSTLHGCKGSASPSPPPAHPGGPLASDASAAGSGQHGARRVILFVWDGLRPDSVVEEDTPRLSELARGGARFPDHHATYPTFTMTNAVSLATGGRPEATGFYGNWLWEPDAERHAVDGTVRVSDAGVPLRYQSTAFTEDYGVLRDLDALYQGKLLPATLFEAAHARSLVTAAIGKSGAAFVQDRHANGIILDEKAVWPLSLVHELQAAGIALPKTTAAAYPPSQVAIEPSRNGDPTTFPPSKKLSDGQSTDPTDRSGAPADRSNAYMMAVYLDYILPTKKPDLSVVWFRNPDTAQHWYGPGTANARQALRDMDALLGTLLDKLTALGWRDSTDVIVVSDHGHSTVSGPLDLFPLRAIVPGKKGGEATVGKPDPSGYAVSGDVRLADLLTRIGKIKAFDGGGCLLDPVLSGITRDGKPLYPVRTDDGSGTACGGDATHGKGGAKFNTPAYALPDHLPSDSVVVAVNGGSDYLYVPSHDAMLVARVVKLLQTREEVGAIFVGSRYPHIAGTLPMREVGIEYPGSRRIPDLVVSYEFDENASVAGMRGIQYESAQNYRGMHGGFGPADIHTTLVASGPDFRREWTDALPTANVDVAPTIAHILGLTLSCDDARVLDESLVADESSAGSYTVESPDPVISDTAAGLRMLLPTDTDGTRVDSSKSRYHVVLKTRRVSRAGKTFVYFDWAKGVRE